MGLTTFRQNRTKNLKTIFQSDDFNVSKLELATSTGGVFLAAPVADEIFELFANAEMILNSDDIVTEFFKKYSTFWSLNRERFERLDDLINVTLDPSNNVDITTVTNHGHTINETTGGTDTTTNSGTDKKTLSGTDTTTNSGTDTVTNGGTDTTTNSGTDTVTDGGKDTIKIDNTDTNTSSGTDTTTNGAKTTANSRAAFDSSTPTPTDSSTVGEHVISVAYGKIEARDTNGTAETTYGHTESTQHGKVETVQHGHTESTQHGKSSATQYGKTESTQHGKSSATQYGKTDNTTHGGTDTVHEYGTRGNFDVSELLKNAIDIEKALYDLRVLFVTEFVRAYCI